MQLQAYLLGLLASASTIKAQAMISWAFYEAGTDCSKNWHDEPSNEDYWTESDGRCLPMNTLSGEYDVSVSALNTGLNAIFPAMYACPTKQCDLTGCILMAAQAWSGQSMGCQHMYNSPYWWIDPVGSPGKRDVKGDETVGWEGVGLGQRKSLNETAGWKGAGLGPRASLNETRTKATEFHA